MRYPRVVDKQQGRVEDIQFLVACGTCVDEICRRMGTSPTALSRFLYRQGLPLLARPFSAEANRLQRRAHGRARAA